MGETRSGTSARHSCDANALDGTVNTAPGTSEITPDATNVEPAAAESLRCAEAAQQESACAWLTTRVEGCSWPSDLCIGQVAPPMQHAIRASGVACQPAQTAMLPTINVSNATTAEARRTRVTTFPRMLEGFASVKSTLGQARWGLNQLLYWACMRRALLLAVLAVVMSDASGLSSLVVPESCPIGTSESAPDSGCPAFCVRCTCACCAASVEHTAPPEAAVEVVPPRALALPSLHALSTGSRADILHVPKALLT